MNKTLLCKYKLQINGLCKSSSGQRLFLLCTGIVFSTMGPVWLKTLPKEKAKLHYFTARLQAEINSKTQFFKALPAFVKEILSKLHWWNTVAHLNDHIATQDDCKTPILTLFSNFIQRTQSQYTLLPAPLVQPVSLHFHTMGTKGDSHSTLFTLCTSCTWNPIITWFTLLTSGTSRTRKTRFTWKIIDIFILTMTFF